MTFQKQETPDIRFVDWGVANNFGDYIEIHKDLPKYPELYKPILKHELRHTKKLFTVEELKMDVTPSGAKLWKLMGFCLIRPKTWIQFLPIYWQRGKGFIWDLNMIIVYTFAVLFLGGIFLWLL